MNVYKQFCLDAEIYEDEAKSAEARGSQIEASCKWALATSMHARAAQVAAKRVERAVWFALPLSLVAVALSVVGLVA